VSLETPDADEVLEAMSHGNIHASQVKATAILLNDGIDRDTAVDTVLAATRALDGTGGWSWGEERANIEGMCDTWLDRLEGEREEKRKVELPKHIPLTMVDWDKRNDLGEPDYLLGNVFSTTTRGLMSADTGLGKTLLGVSMGMHMSLGHAFLHWGKGRPCKVLYVDGEMSRRLLRRRLQDEIARIGETPKEFFALSSEDILMPPLNTTKGQRSIEAVIEQHCHGVDFVVFDNIMSLISGNQAEEEGWAAVQTWARTLTQRAIGQLWIHHSGHNTDRQYGTKTREWQMDLYMHLTKLDHPSTDVSFLLHFFKARERLPEHRDQYADKNIALISNAWQYEGAANAGKRPLSPNEEQYWRSLNDVFVAEGNAANEEASTTLQAWRDQCVLRGQLDNTAVSRNRFSTAKGKIMLKGWIIQTNDVITKL
jgi:hypothetical protein